MTSIFFSRVVFVIIMFIVPLRPPACHCTARITADEAHHTSEDYRLFEVYGPSDRIETAREKLDGLAFMMAAEPGADVWLFSYAGKHACVREATLRAEAIKTYLIGKKVNPQRIRTVNAGFKEQWSVELWIVIRGRKGRPVPSPTVKPSKVHLDQPSRRCTASSFDL
jgi:hypothetical protein